MSEANPGNRFLQHQCSKLARKSAVVRWGDLPPELLAKISNGLSNPTDVCVFRWVCRSWRFSTPPPPNKLSPFFPLRLSWSVLQPRILNIHASGTYLIRRRHENGKAWLATLEESLLGKLVLRHAMTYMKIPHHPGGNVLDLSPDEWIVTQVARSYAEHKICSHCNEIKKTENVVISVPNNCSSSMVGLCSIPESFTRMCAFKLGSSRWGGDARAIYLDCIYRPRIVDFVKLKGWIYAVDVKGFVYAVDSDKSRLHIISSHDLSKYEADYEDVVDRDNPHNLRLIVSDDTIYVVQSCLSKFRIFRLVNLSSDLNGMITSSKWKRVRDLGDRVFFFAFTCSFSVSAADLPPPWQGNCLVLLNDGWGLCRCCPTSGISVYFVGGQIQPKYHEDLGTLGDGYLDLFTLPSSWAPSTCTHDDDHHIQSQDTEQKETTHRRNSKRTRPQVLASTESNS